MSESTFRKITSALSRPRLVRLDGDLYGAVFTLMKIIPAQYILRKAVENGSLTMETEIVETTSGTFGLALAMEAVLLNRSLTLVSDPVIDAPLHRRLTDLGATVEICTQPAATGGFQEARLQRLAEIRATSADTFCPEQYSNPDNPASYALVAEYLEASLGRIDCLVGPVGSGGSMCGTARALRAGSSADAWAIGVDTPRSTLFGQPDGSRALRGLGNSLMPANLDHRVFDEVHWCTPTEAFAATRSLHRRHALFQGPTSGAAYQVARWWAGRNPGARTVVMLPDEGHRYQTTAYDDEWLRANGFAGAVPTEPADVTDPARAMDRWSRMDWSRRTLDEVTALPQGVR